MNHADLTGCEMLEVLAETLSRQGQRLVVANLKGPVAQRLARAGVPHAIRRHGGCLCIDMEQALAIVQGKDPRDAQRDLRELVWHVERARRVLRKHESSH